MDKSNNQIGYHLSVLTCDDSGCETLFNGLYASKSALLRVIREYERKNCIAWHCSYISSRLLDNN